MLDGKPNRWLRLAVTRALMSRAASSGRSTAKLNGCIAGWLLERRPRERESRGSRRGIVTGGQLLTATAQLVFMARLLVI